MDSVGATGAAQNQTQVHGKGHAHRHQHHQGLALGQNEEFRALHDQKRAGELDGPMGAKVVELIQKLKKPEATAEAAPAVEAAAAAPIASQTANDAVALKVDVSLSLGDGFKNIVNSDKIVNQTGESEM